jgi:hypothetical protein
MRWQPASSIWVQLPHRHNFFLWLVYQGRLNPKDNTTSKNWRTDTGCDMCPALESIHHITLHSRNAQRAWHKPNFHHLTSQSNSLISFVEQVQQAKTSKTWLICFAVRVLVLWRTRNNKVYNSKASTRQQLFPEISQEL